MLDDYLRLFLLNLFLYLLIQYMIQNLVFNLTEFDFSAITVKTLGNTLSFYTPSGEGFRVQDAGTTSSAYWTAFGTSTTPPNIILNHTSKSYTKTDLNANTIYYWRIDVKDNKGGKSTGQVWSFKTS